MSQCYSVIIDRVISVPGHGNYVVDGINVIKKNNTYKLISNVKLPISKTFDQQIRMHSCTQKYDVSLAK